MRITYQFWKRCGTTKFWPVTKIFFNTSPIKSAKYRTWKAICRTITAGSWCESRIVRWSERSIDKNCQSSRCGNNCSVRRHLVFPFLDFEYRLAGSGFFNKYRVLRPWARDCANNWAWVNVPMWFQIETPVTGYVESDCRRSPWG